MLFDHPVLFEVPVLPRVQKFIRKKLTDQAGQSHPMLADPQALGAGLMVWAMAQTEKVHLYTNYVHRKGNEPGRRSYRPEELSVEIGLGICEFHRSRHQILFNHAELWVFSNFVDHQIRNELVQYIQLEPELPPMVRIKSFCDLYDFSELDYTELGLKQMYLRHRKGTGGSGFSPFMSTHLGYVPMSLAA